MRVCINVFNSFYPVSQQRRPIRAHSDDSMLSAQHDRDSMDSDSDDGDAGRRGPPKKTAKAPTAASRMKAPAATAVSKGKKKAALVSSPVWSCLSSPVAEVV